MAAGAVAYRIGDATDEDYDDTDGDGFVQYSIVMT
jgi:hypothetical protein